ncbi:hypothetical protein [Streptomyces sp. YIM S03343]
MRRFLLGLVLGACTGAITSAMELAYPWWLVTSAVAAVLVWFGRYAVELLADVVDDLL